MRKLSLVLLVLMSASSAGACDICGCSAMDQRVGVLPDYRKSIVSIGLFHRTFTSTHPPLFSWETPVDSEEFFTTLDIGARYFVNEHWLLMAALPVNHYRQEEEGLTRQLTGVGDLAIGAGRLFSFGDAGRNRGAQVLVSAMAKLPTGRFDAVAGSDAFIVPNLQPGSGSWDALFNVNYMQRLGHWGLQTQASARYNTVNRSDYRFGHRANGAVKLLRFIESERAEGGVLIPGVEVVTSVAGRDLLDVTKNELNPLSGGQMTLVNLGFDYFRGPLGLSVAAGKPVHQNLADGMLQQRWAASAAVTFMF